ncbi:hypothetical protein K7432_001301 [Basidiobolus ranarum]|uniref:PurM-like C-terminal domain-containing protein n=1 Tax=Basidiobolus ranarum TaxID=34480 RepID=A0ABR2X392_9FUNG
MNSYSEAIQHDISPTSTETEAHTDDSLDSPSSVEAELESPPGSSIPLRKCSGDALLDSLLEQLDEERQDNLLELYDQLKQNQIDPQYFLSEARKLCPKKSNTKPIKPVVGDVIILTKPLGTQVVMMAREYLFDEWERRKSNINLSQKEMVQLFSTVTLSMVRTDHVASKLLHKYGTHGVTTVSHLGILGHTKHMLTKLNANVSAEFHTLPMFKGVYAIESELNFGLLKGYLGETSGGWMVVIPKYKADDYIRDIEEAEGWPAFVIGRIVEGDNDAYLANELEIVEVEHVITEASEVP